MRDGKPPHISRDEADGKGKLELETKGEHSLSHFFLEDFRKMSSTGIGLMARITFEQLNPILPLDSILPLH